MGRSRPGEQVPHVSAGRGAGLPVAGFARTEEVGDEAKGISAGSTGGTVTAEADGRIESIGGSLLMES